MSSVRPSFYATMEQMSQINENLAQRRSANFARLRAFVAEADRVIDVQPTIDWPEPTTTDWTDHSPAREPTQRERLDDLRSLIPRRNTPGGQPSPAVAARMVERAAR